MDTRVLSREKRARKHSGCVHASLKASQSINRSVEDEGNFRDGKASTVPKYYILTFWKQLVRPHQQRVSRRGCWSLRFQLWIASLSIEGFCYFHFCSYRHLPNQNDTALKIFLPEPDEFTFWRGIAFRRFIFLTAKFISSIGCSCPRRPSDKVIRLKSLAGQVTVRSKMIVHATATSTRKRQQPACNI